MSASNLWVFVRENGHPYRISGRRPSDHAIDKGEAMLYIPACRIRAILENTVSESVVLDAIAELVSEQP